MMQKSRDDIRISQCCTDSLWEWMKRKVSIKSVNVSGCCILSSAQLPMQREALPTIESSSISSKSTIAWTPGGEKIEKRV